MADAVITDTSNNYLVLSDKDNNRISLRVKRKISTERNFKITEQEMYANESSHHTTNFFNNGDDGLSFKVTILFKKDEVSVLQQLDAWYREMRPFKIAFDVDLSLNLPLVSKDWIVKDITINQEDRNYTAWDVSFRTYNPPKQITVIKNKLVNRTSKSWKWQNNCKKAYKNLNYKDQKKKKWPKSDCCKLLNEIMVELGFLDKEEKSVKTKKKKKGKPVYKTTSYVPDTWVRNDSIDKALKKATKASKKTSSSAIKTFKKEWNKYKLKPVLKANKKGKYEDTIDKDTFKAIGNYAELKSAKKKK